MLPDRVSNLTYESGALPIALRGPASVPQEVCDFTLQLMERCTPVYSKCSFGKENLP